jgi:adenylate cyclase
MVGSSFILRQLDLVKVMGRQQALHIFELLGTPNTALPDAQQRMLQLYAEAMTAYHQRRWDEAFELFKHCRVLCPADGPSLVMSERCKLYRDAPPPEDWDGAFEHLTKD